MAKYNNPIGTEFGNLADDAQALLAATANVAEEKVVQARQRLTAALDTSREAWAKVQDKACQGAHAADEVVRKNPYQAIGVAFGIGAVLGVLFARRD